MSSSYADTPPQTPPGKGSRGSPGSPLVLDENELVSELAFARWKVEMANRLVVAQEKKAADERKAYKDSQDAKFSQYKQSLHKRVGDEFNNSKEQIEAVHSANLEKGKEYKAYLEEMKEMSAHGPTQPMHHGSQVQTSVRLVWYLQPRVITNTRIIMITVLLRHLLLRLHTRRTPAGRLTF